MANYNAAQLAAKLIIDPPDELRFVGPFDHPIVRRLKLENPSDEKVLFKIKTTAPKRYCVRPNFGAVLPNDSVIVEICLQNFKFDPNEKNKHKFMVQSIVCPKMDDLKKGVEIDDPNIWKELPPENFMDAKIKCVFELPDPSATDSKDVKNDVVKHETPSYYGNKETKPIDPLTVEKLDELIRLQKENRILGSEILKLKENILTARSSSSKPPGELYTPVVDQHPIPMFFIAIAIAAVIFGIILGKLVL